MTTEHAQTTCSIGDAADCGCGAPGGSDATGSLRLSAFSRGERISLAVAALVVVAGIAAAALSPDRLEATSVADPGAATHAGCPTTSTPVAAPVATSTPAASAASTTPPASAAATVTTVTPTRTTRRTTRTVRPASTRPATPATRTPAAPAASTRGLVVTFGTYDGSPLRWRVLAESDDDLLLLSDAVLTAGTFQADWESANADRYATSDVRDWLQTTFSTSAFSAEESSALLPHAGGAAGTDKIFLLSAAEVSRYLPTAASRTAGPLTAEAATRIGFGGEPLALTGGHAAWWLADAAGNGSSAKVVGATGALGSQPVYYADLGVRPAIRVDRTKVALSLSSEGAR